MKSGRSRAYLAIVRIADANLEELNLLLVGEGSHDGECISGVCCVGNGSLMLSTAEICGFVASHTISTRRL